MALYRTYRPSTFAEVVGQEHVTEPLSVALDSGRINHAYLFSGPRGCGKTSSARILARSLNCAEGPTSTPCGVCSSCVALAPGGPGNLDVVELDAASHGGVDDTRELRDRAFYAPAESRYRVFIVDEAHMVTTAGFNALLKIVEEPPEHLIFVFATTEPEKVLPTIRSRTHHYPFRLLAPQVMRGLLERITTAESVQVQDAVYPLVIRAGGGSPRDTLSILDQLFAGAEDSLVRYDRAVALLGVTDVALIDETIEALAAGDGAGVFGAVQKVVDAGHDPRRFAVDLLDRLRDLILVRAVPDATGRGLVDVPSDVAERIVEQAGRIGPATLARYAEVVHAGLGEMRGATAPRLLLEVMCARMLLPDAANDQAALLQRVETVERSVAGGLSVAASAPAPSSASVSTPAAPTPAGPASAGSSVPPTGDDADSRRTFVRPSARTESAPAAPHPREVEPAERATSAEPPREPAAATPSADSGSTAAVDASIEPAHTPQDSGPAPAAAQTTPTPTAATPTVPGPAAGESRSAESRGESQRPAGRRPDPAAPRPDESPQQSEPAPQRSEAAPQRTEPVAQRDESAAHRREPVAGRPEPAPAAPADAQHAPPPAQSAAPTGVDLESVRANWQRVRDVVRGHSRTVEVMLSGASVQAVGDGRLVLTHESVPLAKRLVEPRNAEAIRGAFREVFGVDVTVECVTGQAEPARPADRRTAAPARGDRKEKPTFTRPKRDAAPAAEAAPPRPERRIAPPPADDEPPIPEAPPMEDEEEEMLAEAARDRDSGNDGPSQPRRDPQEIALELLQSELGARPIGD
ncbi:DNA polymerase III subunits gamma/tau [Millisia brevis]|uniref:DNA polymerase III subunits gamma/tau n=1 Tax=Millisia brevis TaxID=264148 RepID=UPI000835FEA7|nr:DNA polymerase III subunits gamma/tau [Millisia brevis]